MAGHLTSGQMVLVKKLKKNVEKYVTAMSHLEFLQKCQENINIRDEMGLSREGRALVGRSSGLV